MNHYRKIFLIALFLSFLLTGVGKAQLSVRVTPEPVEYVFGEKMVFRARVESGLELARVDLILEAPGTPSFIGAAGFSADGAVDFTYDLAQRPLPAFADIQYHYRLVFSNGEEFTSPTYTFTYFDDRMDWRTLEDGVFTVHWYRGDLPFAREVLDAAFQARTRVLELIQQPEDGREIDIFVYGAEEDLQATLAMSGQDWVAGHADPELGAVVVSLPPGADQSLEIQQRIPHELTHIILYRFMGTEYQYLPTWVNEGIASQMEFYPRPAYDDALERAQERGELIPLAQLCQSLPTDEEQVLLAYAESNSVMGYIRQKYGVTGIQAMISAYDQGVGCSRGVEMALGTPLSGLEKEWKREVFSQGTISSLWLMFMPWLVVLGIIAVPLGGILLIRFYLRKEQGALEEEHVGEY